MLSKSSVREEWKSRAEELREALFEEERLLDGVDEASARRQEQMRNQINLAKERERSSKALLHAKSKELAELQCRILETTIEMEENEGEIKRLGVACRKLTASKRSAKLRSVKWKAHISEQQQRIQSSKERIQRLKLKLKNTENETLKREKIHAEGYDAAKRDLMRWLAQLNMARENRDVNGVDLSKEYKKVEVEHALLEKQLLEARISLGKDSETCAGHDKCVSLLEEKLAALYSGQDAIIRKFESRVSNVLEGNSLQFSSDNLVGAREAQILAIQCKEWLNRQVSAEHEYSGDNRAAQFEDGPHLAPHGQEHEADVSESTKFDFKESSWDLWLSNRRKTLDHQMKKSNNNFQGSLCFDNSSQKDRRLSPDLGGASSLVEEINDILSPKRALHALNGSKSPTAFGIASNTPMTNIQNNDLPKTEEKTSDLNQGKSFNPFESVLDSVKLSPKITHKDDGISNQSRHHFNPFELLSNSGMSKILNNAQSPRDIGKTALHSDSTVTMTKLWDGAKLFFQEADLSGKGILSYADIQTRISEQMHSKKGLHLSKAKWKALQTAMDSMRIVEMSRDEWCRFFVKIVSSCIDGSKEQFAGDLYII